MFVVKAKIYGVLYKQSSSTAFDETSSNWLAPKEFESSVEWKISAYEAHTQEQ